MGKVCLEPVRTWVARWEDEATAVQADSEGKARALAAREWGLTRDESALLDVSHGVPGWLDCPVCGAETLESEDGLFWEDEEATCHECGTVCCVRVSSAYSAYLSEVLS